MATATFSQARAALGLTVRTRVAGLLQVLDLVPDSVSAPSAVIQPAPGDFLRTPMIGQDGCNLLFLVTLYLPGADVEAGQTLLDGFLAPTGASSVIAAINADPTLGGVVASSWCTTARGYRAEQHDEQRYIAVDFPVEVMT